MGSFQSCCSAGGPRPPEKNWLRISLPRGRLRHQLASSLITHQLRHGRKGRTGKEVAKNQFLEKGLDKSCLLKDNDAVAGSEHKTDLSCNKKIKEQSHQSLPQPLRALRAEPKGKPI